MFCLVILRNQSRQKHESSIEVELKCSGYVLKNRKIYGFTAGVCLSVTALRGKETCYIVFV